MKRLIAAIKGDMLLQLKYGLYGIYAIITCVYIFGLRLLPLDYTGMAIPLIIFSDPSFLGFFFIGGLVLLEKGEGTLDYLMVTPLRVHEYLIAKLTSLTLIAVFAGLLLVWVAGNGGVNYFRLLSGIILTSCFFTLVGFMAAVRSRTVNAYLVNTLPYIFFLSLPLAGVFNPLPSRYFLLFPTQAALYLIWGAFLPVEPGETAYALVFLVLSIILAYRRACWMFNRYLAGRG